MTRALSMLTTLVLLTAAGLGAQAARDVEVVATDFDFDPERIQAEPGQELAVKLVNRGNSPHNIEFELPTGEKELENNVPPGQSATLRITAPREPGTYTFYCPVGNHRQRGMEGQLVVTGNTGQTGQNRQQAEPTRQTGQADARDRGRAGQASVPLIDTTAGAIAAAPQAYYGNLVRVTAEVEDVVSPHVFLLDEDRIGAGPDVLVVYPRPIGAVPEGDDVTVVGHVRPLVRTYFERDYDWFDWGWFNEVEGEVEVETRPVIVASSVVSAGRELMPEWRWVWE